MLSLSFWHEPQQSSASASSCTSTSRTRGGSRHGFSLGRAGWFDNIYYSASDNHSQKWHADRRLTGPDSPSVLDENLPEGVGRGSWRSDCAMLLVLAAGWQPVQTKDAGSTTTTNCCEAPNGSLHTWRTWYVIHAIRNSSWLFNDLELNIPFSRGVASS